jgi:hypothetical protein
LLQTALIAGNPIEVSLRALAASMMLALLVVSELSLPAPCARDVVAELHSAAGDSH